MFNPWDIPEGEINPIVDYLVNSGADIICLQEAGYDVNGWSAIDSTFKSVYQYRDTTRKGGTAGDVLALYSKFPILSKERVKYASKGNLSEAYILKINGKKVLLVNNHFETVGLNKETKAVSTNLFMARWSVTLPAMSRCSCLARSAGMPGNVPHRQMLSMSSWQNTAGRA